MRANAAKDKAVQSQLKRKASRNIMPAVIGSHEPHMFDAPKTLGAQLADVVVASAANLSSIEASPPVRVTSCGIVDAPLALPRATAHCSQSWL